jgi:hypothetical protein
VKTLLFAAVSILTLDLGAAKAADVPATPNWNWAKLRSS